MSTTKIDQDQIEGQIVNSVSGNGVNNNDPKNPIINIPDLAGYATQIWVNSQGFLTEEADPFGIQSQEVTGSSTKTLKTVLRNGTVISASWVDENTTYTGLTLSDLNSSNPDTAHRLISASVLTSYDISKLIGVLKWKGTVTNFSNLPTTNNQVGDVYNIGNSFSFEGKNYPAGSNVAWSELNKWDVLQGFIDTSMFLTSETDPTGVSTISVSGTTTKTISVTLNNGTTKSASWEDTNTIPVEGTLASLNAASSTVSKIWSEKILNDWLNGKSFTSIADVTTFLGTQKSEIFIIVAGNISSGVVTLNLSAPRKVTNLVLAFYNGIKIPGSATSLNATFNQLKVTQSQIATPIKVGKQVEVVYMG